MCMVVCLTTDRPLSRSVLVGDADHSRLCACPGSLQMGKLLRPMPSRTTCHICLILVFSPLAQYCQPTHDTIRVTRKLPDDAGAEILLTQRASDANQTGHLCFIQCRAMCDNPTKLFGMLPFVHHPNTYAIQKKKKKRAFRSITAVSRCPQVRV